MTRNRTRADDISDIKELKYRYSYGANIIDGKPGDIKAFAALYSRDATFDVGMGVATGPAEIEAMMNSLTTQWYCAMHYMLNPVIEVNGDRANGQFTGLIAFVKHSGDAPVWFSNIYSDTFIRLPEGWRFQSTRVDAAFADPAFLAAYADHLQN